MAPSARETLTATDPVGKLLAYHGLDAQHFVERYTVKGRPAR